MTTALKETIRDPYLRVIISPYQSDQVWASRNIDAPLEDADIKLASHSTTTFAYRHPLDP